MKIIIKTLLAMIVFASILLPVQNNHLLQAAAAVNAQYLLTFSYDDCAPKEYKYIYSVDGITVQEGNRVPDKVKWASISTFKTFNNYRGNWLDIGDKEYIYSVDGVTTQTGNSVPANVRWATIYNFSTSCYTNWVWFLPIKDQQFIYSIDGITTQTGTSIPANAKWATLSFFRVHESYRGYWNGEGTGLQPIYGQIFEFYSINSEPSISISTPATNQSFSSVNGYNQISVVGTISDNDIGDVLKAYYRIDGSAGQPGTQLGADVTSSGTTQALNGTIDVSGVAEGSHIISFWAEDDKGGKSAEAAVAFRVDKTAPNNFVPVATANSSSQITVSGSTTDPTSNGVTTGLHANPYRFTSSATGTWTGWTTNTSQAYTGLTANTQYTVQMEAQDAVGNVRQTSVIHRFTQALNPTLLVVAAKNNSSMTFNITNNSGNGTPPQHRIEVKLKGAGAGGTVVSASDFNNTTTNRVVSGLVEGTAYEIWCITRNGDGVANSPIKMIDSVTTNSQPRLSVTNDNQYKSIVPGYETITLQGRVWDADGDKVTITATLNGAVRTVVVNPAPTSDPGSNNWSLTWDVAGDGVPEGTYTGIIISANDGVCTPATTTFSSNIVVDLTAPPDPIITMVPSGWTNTDVTVTISNIKDGLSGVERLDYSTNDGSTVQSHPSTANLLITLADTGQHVITSKTIDKAGNQSNLVKRTANIDKVAPVITFNGVMDGNKYYTQPFTPGYSASYSISGRATETVSMTKDGQPYIWVKDDPITAPGSYVISVTAVDQAGNSTTRACAFEIALPEVPQAPILTPLSSSEVKVDWLAATGAEEYTVLRDGTAIATTNQLTYQDTSLVANTEYAYRIDAKNPVGTSTGVEQTTITHANVPTSLKIADITTNGLSLLWEANGNPTGTEYLAGCIETAQESGWITETKFYFTGLSSAQSYNFWVKARNFDGIETVTESVYGTIAAPTLPDVEVEPGENPGESKVKGYEPLPGTHYEYKVQQVPFLPPPAVGELFTGTNFTPPANIKVTVGDYLGIALCDDVTGVVIKFKEFRITDSDVSILDRLIVTPNPLAVPKGLIQQLNVAAHYTGGSVINVTRDATYASDTISVATVDGEGLVSAIQEGTSNISVNYSSQSVVVPLTVGQSVGVGLSITPAISEITVGGTQQYTASLAYSDGQVEDVTNSALWSITDEAVATMDNGLVTAHSPGEVIISAGHSGQIALQGIRIKSAPSGGGGGGGGETAPPEPETIPEPIPEPLPLPEPKPELKTTPAPMPLPEPQPEPVVVITPEPKQIQTQASNPVKMGVIYGRVVDAAGNPLPNLLVELYSIVQRTFTDQNGYYRFENVEPGEHHIYLRDKTGLIELAQATLVVIPGMNRVESAVGGKSGNKDAKVHVRTEATGEQINFIISEEKLALITPPSITPTERPDNPKLMSVATATVATVTSGALLFYCILLPYRRKYNVFIRTKGKALAKYKIEPQRIVVFTLTNQIRNASEPINVEFKNSFLKHMVKLEGAIVLRHEDADLSVYRIGEYKKQLKATIDVNTLDVVWSEGK